MLIRDLSLPRRAKTLHEPPAEKLFTNFLALPGEIRNKIYDLLIIHAFSSCRNPCDTITLYTPHHTFESPVLKPTGLSITATPTWGTDPRFRIKNIGHLQILLVNRQIHDEVSTLLYSHAHDLTVGGYILQFRDENPALRWQAMFKMLERRTGLLESVKDLTIRMPSQREDLLKGYWRLLGFLRPPRGKTISQNLWVGIPGMVDFVEKFQRAEQIHIVVTMEERDPPDFEDLYALFRAAGMVSKPDVEFALAIWDSQKSMIFLDKWNEAWKKLVAEREEMELGIAIERSNM